MHQEIPVSGVLAGGILGRRTEKKAAGCCRVQSRVCSARTVSMALE